MIEHAPAVFVGGQDKTLYLGGFFQTLKCNLLAQYFREQKRGQTPDWKLQKIYAHLRGTYREGEPKFQERCEHQTAVDASFNRVGWLDCCAVPPGRIFQHRSTISRNAKPLFKAIEKKWKTLP